jgi:hypothetical protein
MEKCVTEYLVVIEGAATAGRRMCPIFRGAFRPAPAERKSSN